MTAQWTDERLDRLASTVESTSVKLDSFIFEASRLFNKLGESQARNDAAVESTNIKLDNFVFEASRLFTKLGESQARNEAAVETLLAAVTRLTQSQESQWQAIREMQIDVREMQSEVKGLQVENRRILQRIFGDEF